MINDRQYLSITFNDSKLNTVFLEHFVDSIKNKNGKIPDSVLMLFFKGDSIYSQERLLHFSNPDEWYLIGFDATPCWIINVYNKEISSEVINKRKELSDYDLKRIETRFRNEILNQAESYGKTHHFPDSILYNTIYN